MTDEIGCEQLPHVHLVALVVPLLEDEREGALARILELRGLGRQFLDGLVDLLDEHGLLGAAYDLEQH